MKRQALFRIPGGSRLSVLLSGVFLSAAFPPYGYAPVAWIAFVPLIRTVCDGQISVRNAALTGFLFGFGHRITSMYWIEYVLQKYGYLPFLPSVVLCVLLCGYLALYPALFAIAARYLGVLRYNWLVLPSLWVVLEWVQAKALTGFPWNLVGYSQGSILHALQSADLWGVYGLSFAVLLINSVLASLLAKRPSSLTGAAFAVLLMVVIFFYGDHKIKVYNTAKGNDQCSEVAIVQGNIDQAVKWDAEFRKNTVDKYLKLSRQAILQNKHIDLIVWPETAMPFFFEFDPDFSAAIGRFAQEEGIALFFGSPGISFGNGEEIQGFLNNAYLVNAEGTTVGKYSKEHLVPFGEYVPLKKLLFFVKRLVPAAGDFIPGKTPGIISYGKMRMGVLICYEAIFPELARKRVDSGANVLVNISNDAWFGKTAAPFQHLEMARWRAVETRRPMLRATNTGISAFIDPVGRIKPALGLFKEGFIIGSICPGEGLTYYARFGDWLVILCALTTFTGVLYVRLREKRKQGGREYEG